MTEPGRVPCIIRLTPEAAKPAGMLQRLADLGVQIDEDYGVFPINESGTVFVTRGLVPEDQVPIIEADRRVALFPEIGLRPV